MTGFKEERFDLDCDGAIEEEEEEEEEEQNELGPGGSE